MIRAVVDTNIWVSAAINPKGFPARVADAFAQGDFVAVLPETVLAEIRDVLGRERIRRLTGHDPQDVDRFLALIETRAEVVSIEGQPMVAGMQRTTRYWNAPSDRGPRPS